MFRLSSFVAFYRAVAPVSCQTGGLSDIEDAGGDAGGDAARWWRRCGAGGDAVVLVETLVEKRNKNPRRRRRENHRRAKLILNMSDMFTLAVRVYCLS